MTSQREVPTLPPRSGGGPPSDETGFSGVVSAGVLRGLTLSCTAQVTILLDADADGGGRAGALALRLLAGIGRPQAGRVRALGVDPATDAARRREIALLGDPVLLEPGLPIDAAVSRLAHARGAEVPELPAGPGDDLRVRRAATDAVACVGRARLVLLSHPEQYVDPIERDAISSSVRAAISRGARVLVATGSLDEVLNLAQTGDAVAAVLSHGRLVTVGPAHGLPWSIPLDGVSTRVVRVLLAPEPEAPGDAPLAGPSASARLAADLLSDPVVSPLLSVVEPLGPFELRLHAREPRTVARAIAARAHEGLPVRQLSVSGAPSRTLTAVFGGGVP